MVSYGILNYNQLCVVNILWVINDPNSPLYIPSLFPDIHKKKQVNQQQQSDRYHQKVKHKKIVVTNDVEPLDVEIIEHRQYDKIISVCSVGTQVMFDFNNNQIKFECEFNKTNCDVGTLASIPPLSNNSIERSVKRLHVALIYLV